MKFLVMALLSHPVMVSPKPSAIVKMPHCDTSHMGDELKPKHVAAIQEAVARIKDTIVVLTISDELGAGCHMENFLSHASSVSKREGFPPIVNIALDKSVQSRCTHLANSTEQKLGLDLQCVSIASHLGVPKKTRNILGHGSCWYRHVAWVRPFVLMAAVAKADKGVFSLDVDVLVHRNLWTWVRNEWSKIAGKHLLCQAFEYDNPPSYIHGPDRDCNGGQILFPNNKRSLGLLRSWSEMAKDPKGHAKTQPSFGNQFGLNQVLKTEYSTPIAYLLPMPQFSACGIQSDDSITVHHNMCRRVHDVDVYDDRTKLPQMMKQGVWRPFSEECQDTQRLLELARKRSHSEL